MSDMKKVQSGERVQIPASTWNNMIDAARAHRQRQSDVGRSPHPVVSDTDLVNVRNDSGADQDRFAVLGIDGSMFHAALGEPPERSPAMKGVVPAHDRHAGRFIVLLEPLAAGEIGLGMVSGVCPMKLWVVDEKHRFADVRAGDAVMLMTTAHGNAEILWKEEGIGERWATVRIGGGADLQPMNAKQLASAVMRAYSEKNDVAAEVQVIMLLNRLLMHCHDDSHSQIAWNDVQAIVAHNIAFGDNLPVPMTASEGYNQHGHTGPYDGGYIPGRGAHDHRDAMNGGFAFAVYHPGHDLPQQPFAI